MNKRNVVIFATAFALFASGMNVKMCRDRSKEFIQYIDAYTQDIVDDDFYISAHRGFSSLEVENTKGAISLAASKGYVDYIEFDVRMTKDNRIVLSHNNSLMKANGDLTDVSSMTYEEAINTLFSYSPSVFSNFSFGNEEKMMMAQRYKDLRCVNYHLIGLLDGINYCGSKLMLMDLKFNNDIELFTEELLKELDGVDTRNIIFQSLNIDGIKHLQENSNYNCLALISNASDIKRSKEFARVGLKYNLVTYDLVSSLLAEGKTVAIWTVNSTEVLDRLISILGDHYKDVIYITDYPDLMTVRLHEYENGRPLVLR